MQQTQRFSPSFAQVSSLHVVLKPSGIPLLACLNSWCVVQLNVVQLGCGAVCQYERVSARCATLARGVIESHDIVCASAAAMKEAERAFQRLTAMNGKINSCGRCVTFNIGSMQQA